MAQMRCLNELHFDEAACEKIARLSDLALAPRLTRLEIWSREVADFKIPVVEAPANLEVFRFQGSISVQAVKTILSTAPKCEIEAGEPATEFKIERGKRYRSRKGKVEYYEFRESQGGFGFGDARWKVLAE